MNEAVYDKTNKGESSISNELTELIIIFILCTLTSTSELVLTCFKCEIKR